MPSTTTRESAVNACARFALWLQGERVSDANYTIALHVAGALVRQLRARGREPSAFDLQTVDIPAAWADENERLQQDDQRLGRQQFVWPALMLQRFVVTHPASERELLFD